VVLPVRSKILKSISGSCPIKAGFPGEKFCRI